MEVYAPAGKLGVVLDTADGDGCPVVFAVKETSVLASQVLVGDKLIAVDHEDVSHQAEIKVSKIICKSENSSRKLTFVRTSVNE